jgi:hypothetical protein
LQPPLFFRSRCSPPLFRLRLAFAKITTTSGRAAALSVEILRVAWLRLSLGALPTQPRTVPNANGDDPM